MRVCPSQMGNGLMCTLFTSGNQHLEVKEEHNEKGFQSLTAFHTEWKNPREGEEGVGVGGKPAPVLLAEFNP